MTKEMIIISVEISEDLDKSYIEYMHNGLQYGTIISAEEVKDYSFASGFTGNGLLCDFILHVQEKYKIYHLN